MGEADVIPLGGRRSAEMEEHPTRERPRCKATTSTGRPCRNLASDDSGYCHVHQRRDEEPSVPIELTTEEEFDGSALDRLGDFLRRRLSGNYDVDDFGYDRELSRRVLLPIARPLYERYFRVKTLGIGRLPDEGPALLVANHSGTVALDAVMMQYAVATEHPQQRVIRNVAADLVFQLPFVGPMARKAGNVVACDEDADELLRRGELVGVFPEGYKGVGKGWRERYRLQRFGRGGFIEVALRQRVPIVPVAIVGAEEAYPMIADLRGVAKTFGFPYFPITPTWPLLGPLGLIPLPSRWIMEFGEPIPMDSHPEDAAEDKMLVFDLADEVRDTIQQLLYKNLKYRGGTFL
jgi:1-acyl-sn-glycerol-3-phosphate acyltransferase